MGPRTEGEEERRSMREVLRAWTGEGEGGEDEGEARESGRRRQTSQPCRTMVG